MARNRQQALWTSDRRLYLDAAGQVVEASDPARASLLVAAGNSIPMEQAIRLGLAEAPAASESEEGLVAMPKSRGRGPNRARPAPADKNKSPVDTKGGEPDPNAPAE